MAGNIYVTGDMHGDIELSKLSSRKWPEGKTLDREDYLIVTGDMGILWHNEDKKHEKHLKKWYSTQKKWTTLFIDGNHENHKRLMDLPTKKMFGGIVGVVHDHIYHLRRGRIYTIHGKTFFVMGGATSWDKAHRLIDVSWWSEEVPTVQEMDVGLENLRNHGWEVDYILTHTVPRTILPMLGLSNTKNGEQCPVAGYCDHILRNTKYKEWYTGHIHIDKTIGKIRILYWDIVKIL